jgi:hypothetical protein
MFWLGDTVVIPTKTGNAVDGLKYQPSSDTLEPHRHIRRASGRIHVRRDGQRVGGAVWLGRFWQSLLVL